MPRDDSKPPGRVTSYLPMSVAKQLEKQLDELKAKKADDSVVISLKEGIADAKRMATEAVKESSRHPCINLDKIDRLERMTYSWSLWFRGAIVTFVAAIAGIGATLFFKLSDYSANSARIEQKVDNLTEVVDKMTKEDKADGRNERKRKEELDSLEKTIIEALRLKTN